jgi:hypothetical protein
MKKGTLVEIKLSEGTKKEYGTFLATDSEGKSVIELKTGGIASFDEEALEKVMPYSVGVKFLNDFSKNSTNESKQYNYLVKKGSIKLGDLLYLDSTSGLAKVVELDTKSEQATAELSGWVLSGQPIGQ